MIKPEMPSEQQTIEVKPQDVTLILAENGSRALTFVLPPLEDLAEMEALKDAHFSIRRPMSKTKKEADAWLERELKLLQRKSSRFHQSSTFHNRVSNLAAMAGRFDEEAASIRRAKEISTDPYFVHKVAENLLARGHVDEAKSLIGTLDLRTDLYANLRLAYFCVQNFNLNKAEEYVNHAIELDPLDFGSQLFMGALSILQGRHAKAIQAFRIAAEVRETSSALFSNMAIAYFQLGEIKRALGAVKRSVALDPLNVNAVVLLADLAFMLKENDDAIPSLRYFVEFDQKNAGVWARFARALFLIGKHAECAQALKMQGSLEETSALWNNLGVAYQHLKIPPKAMPAFQHAMQLDVRSKGPDYFLAARNLAQSFVAIGKLDTATSFIQAVLAEDTQDICLRHEAACDIYSIYVHLLTRARRNGEAVSIVESALAKPNLAHNFTTWAVTSLISQYALNDRAEDRAKSLFERFDKTMRGLVSGDPAKKINYFNNVAFAFAEFNHLDEAESYLSEISFALHKNAFATATLGLIHLRNGEIARGIALYREAISLAEPLIHKAMIRQKLNVELGRYWLQEDPRKARRFLTRAANSAMGELSLQKRAVDLLRDAPY
jgi:tetratricopeptide (TPR) repeat protein